MVLRPSRYLDVLTYITEHPEGVTRSQVYRELKLISYGSARWYLERAVKEGRATKERRPIDKLFEWLYKPILKYYRTQLAKMFYTENPRVKTSDPIAEYRVTVVSMERGRYPISLFEPVITHLGIILSPQTFWIKLPWYETAAEIDEEIDPDELPLSVPVYGRLNYCERYAVFYRSRREAREYYRVELPEYWGVKAKVETRRGDYEYDEAYVKAAEEDAIRVGRVRTRFENETGRLRVV